MKTVEFTIGSDVCAYATISVGIDESATKAEIIAAVRQQMELEEAGENLVFDEDWSTQTNLRIVVVNDIDVQNLVGFTSLEPAQEDPQTTTAATPKALVQRAIGKIDDDFERLNTLLDVSGCLDSAPLQRCAYQLRLSIAKALGDQARIDAAKASLKEIDVASADA